MLYNITRTLLCITIFVTLWFHCVRFSFSRLFYKILCVRSVECFRARLPNHVCSLFNEKNWTWLYYIVVLFVSRCCLHHFLRSCFSPSEEKMILQTETLMKKLLLLNLHRNPHTHTHTAISFLKHFFPTILSSFDYTSTRKHIKHWNMFFKIFHNCFGSLSLSSHS